MRAAAQATPGVMPLTALALAARARVVRVDGECEKKVGSFGILPGVEIQLRQRYPTFVVRCDHVEVALETSVAKGIWVEGLSAPRRRRFRFRHRLRQR